MKVLIIDDDKIICLALKTIIETVPDIEVVSIGHSYEDAIKKYKQYLPDVCLFDIRIGEKTGIDAMKTLKKDNPESKIIFLTTFLDDEYIKDSINFGGSGYILKDEFENIIPAIKSVYAGQKVFGKTVVESISKISKKSRTKDDFPHLPKSLSNREIDILKLIANGLNNKEIASKLYLSEGTVRNYISSLLEKLELRDRTQLAIYYYKR